MTREKIKNSIMIQNKDTYLSSQIAALTGSVQTQCLDEQARSEALDAARGLLAALQSPVERVIQDVVMVCSSKTPYFKPLCCNPAMWPLSISTNSEYIAPTIFDGSSYGCSTGHFYPDQPKPRMRRFLPRDCREIRCKLDPCW